MDERRFPRDPRRRARARARMARDRLVNLAVAARTRAALEGQRRVPVRLHLGAPLNAAQRRVVAGLERELA
eukprot:4782961-Lingulodinium_polyedra.AAC.1